MFIFYTKLTAKKSSLLPDIISVTEASVAKLDKTSATLPLFGSCSCWICSSCTGIQYRYFIFRYQCPHYRGITQQLLGQWNIVVISTVSFKSTHSLMVTKLAQTSLDTLWSLILWKVGLASFPTYCSDNFMVRWTTVSANYKFSWASKMVTFGSFSTKLCQKLRR